MIELTRVGSGVSFFLNPDLIERIDTHVDTVVRLASGIEYVVAEDGEEIVARIVTYRGRILNALPTIGGPDGDDPDDPDIHPAGTHPADTPAEHEAAR